MSVQGGANSENEAAALEQLRAVVAQLMEGLEAAWEAASSYGAHDGHIVSGRPAGPEQGPGGSGGPGDQGDQLLEGGNATGSGSGDENPAAQQNPPSGPDWNGTKPVISGPNAPSKDTAVAETAEGRAKSTAGTVSLAGEGAWGPRGGAGTVGNTVGKGLSNSTGRFIGEENVSCATSCGQEGGKDREVVENMSVQGDPVSLALDQYRRAVLVFLQGQRDILLSVNNNVTNSISSESV